MSEGSHELSRGTRAKPVSGGTTICPHCGGQRIAGSAYCREKRNEYQRDWRKKLSRELKELRARVAQPIDDSRKVVNDFGIGQTASAGK